MLRYFLKVFLVLAVVCCTLQAQSTNPSIRSGSSLPSLCTPGSSRSSLFYKTGASSGLYQCLTTNNWTPVGSGTGSAAAAGSGTEVQINSAGSLAALSGSSASGANLTLGGQLAVTGGNVLAGRNPVGVFETSQSDFAAGTLSSTQSNAAGTLTLADAANGTRKAVNFNGSRSNQILIAHNAAYNLTGDLTIEGWAYLENPMSFSSIISKGASGQTFDLVLQSGGGTSVNSYGWLRFGQGGAYVSTEAVAALRLNQWHHIAVTKSGTTVKFYVNGTLVRTTTLSASVPTNTDGLYIGHAPDAFVTGGYIFRGSLFDIRLWNVARTDSEISSNFNTLTPAGSGLVGQWRMQEGTGTSIADSSATANNGTLSGDNYAWRNVTSNYALSGTRTSPVYDISAAKTISTSNISWTETKSDGHTLAVETRYSTDGGSSYSSWTAATNGSTVPGLSSTIDLSNGRLQIRQTLTSTTSLASPILNDVSVTLTTPAFEYKLGVRNTSPQSALDASNNTIQGKILDTGGAFLNVTAPRYGAIPDDGLPDDAAFAAALADLGPARSYNTSTGKIFVPKGVFDFANDLEINHIIVLEGGGGDKFAPVTTLSFADGKGIKIPAGEVMGGYGTDFGSGRGTSIRDVFIVSKGKANVPTATVNVSGLTVTRTAGSFFQAERWGAAQVVKIGSTYARISVWNSDTTATLAPLFYAGSVSGTTVTKTFGNAFPAGLSGVIVKIDGVSYTVSSSTTTTLTLSSTPAETGPRTIEIQSLGTLTSQAMQIFSVHGIETGGLLNLSNVAVSGFPGNGVDVNTANWNYENARNSNTCSFSNVLTIDNEGHGLLVQGGNSNASIFSAINAFNNRGNGIYEGSQFGNTYIAPHTDSNSMEPFFAGSSSSSVIGMYSEGNQPASRLTTDVGGATIIGGFYGSGLTYDTNALLISNTREIKNVKGIQFLDASDGITLNSQMAFKRFGDVYRTINFGHGFAGSGESAAIQQASNGLYFYTNTYNSGGSPLTPTAASAPSWYQVLSSSNDYVRWYRAAATAGTPSFSQVAEISPTGFSTNNITAGGKLYITNPETPASASASCVVGQQAWDTNFHYVCVATNTWKRAALSSW